MGRVRKHHYLPQGYQRGFSVDGEGKQIRHIVKADQRHFSASIIDTGCERDFHTFTKDGVRDDNSLETTLAQLEDLQAQAIRRVTKNEELLPGEKDLLISFVALMQFRVPAFKDHMEGVIKGFSHMTAEMIAKDDRLEQGMAKIGDPQFQKYPKPIQKVIFDCARAAMDEGRVNFTVPNGKLLAYMFSFAFDRGLTAKLQSMGWAILEAHPDAFFITCDQPVVFYDEEAWPNDPKGRPLISLSGRGMEVSVALDRNTTLMLDSGFGIGERVKLSLAKTTEMNRRTIVMADRYILTPEVDDDLLRQVRENSCYHAGQEFSYRTIEKGQKYLPMMKRAAVCPANHYQPSAS